MSTIYLQSIAGYYGAKEVYEQRACQLSDAGFVCLRSTPNEQGQSWEIWMISSPILAKGLLRGKSEEDIIQWCRQLGIGHIEYGGKVLGLSLG